MGNFVRCAPDARERSRGTPIRPTGKLRKTHLGGRKEVLLFLQACAKLGTGPSSPGGAAPARLAHRAYLR